MEEYEYLKQENEYLKKRVDYLIRSINRKEEVIIDLQHDINRIDYFNFDIMLYWDFKKYSYKVLVNDLENSVILYIDYNTFEQYDLDGIVDYIKKNYDIFYYDYKGVDYSKYLKYSDYNKLINKKYKLYYVHKN